MHVSGEGLGEGAASAKGLWLNCVPRSSEERGGEVEGVIGKITKVWTLGHPMLGVPR